ncbi:hypothetical protein FRC09_008283 [Ceratobasidium sp. 395]|nr:hypothetical protein FRC09_008283 [Ceratobasidium sp. 395]
MTKLCNFLDVPPAYNKAERFVQNHGEPNSSEGEEGAVEIWSQFCHAGSQVDMPAGLAAFDKETHKAYTERWTKIYGVNPSEDKTCNPPRFHHPDEIVRKRKLLWQFGLSLSASANRLKHLLEISIRVYACLPLYVSGLDARACFYPSADLLNKKKMAQIERQSRVFLRGTGLAMWTTHRHKIHLNATHLENYPVLLQLTGTHFFNNFELMRFMHGGPAGVKSSTLKNNAEAVTSAAIGMGIFVMLPLMTEPMRARYILQAAVLVEHFSPSIVDGYPESTWWTDSIPHAVSLDLNQDLPQAVQTLIDSRVEQQAQDAALASDLDITAPADITLTALPLQGEWPEELNHLALLPQGLLLLLSMISPGLMDG